DRSSDVCPSDLALFRVGIAEAVVLALLREAREIGPLGEEVGVSALKLLERLLQRMHRRIGQPRRFRPIAPLGEQLAQAGVTELLLALLVALLLLRQRSVEDEAARPGEAADVALLLAGRHQFVFEGLQTLHGRNGTLGLSATTTIFGTVGTASF